MFDKQMKAHDVGVFILDTTNTHTHTHTHTRSRFRVHKNDETRMSEFDGRLRKQSWDKSCDGKVFLYRTKPTASLDVRAKPVNRCRRTACKPNESEFAQIRSKRKERKLK